MQFMWQYDMIHVNTKLLQISRQYILNMGQFNCDQCEYQGTVLRNLNRDNRRIHDLNSLLANRGRFICDKCD